MKDTERHNYIGDHIRKLREEKGWTQQVLGKKLGKKTSTISAYETNAKLPSVDCLIEMAELFDVDRTVITKHLKNIFESSELQINSVCAKFAHTADDGKTYNTAFYNLDAIIWPSGTCR
mgnify:CR=1 FL=1